MGDSSSHVFSASKFRSSSPFETYTCRSRLLLVLLVLFVLLVLLQHVSADDV
jgi:hypothetical protein